MVTVEEKHRNILESLLPPFIAFAVLCAVGMIFFPYYWPVIHKDVPHTGRPDYEQRFQTALARDKAGGRKSSEGIYRSIIGAASPARGCPNLNVPTADSPRLKAMAYIAIGVMRSCRGKSASALDAFQEGAQREPDDAINAFYLGYGLAKLGRSEEAKATYQKASAIGHGVVKQDAEAALQTLNRK